MRIRCLGALRPPRWHAVITEADGVGQTRVPGGTGGALGIALPWAAVQEARAVPSVKREFVILEFSSIGRVD